MLEKSKSAKLQFISFLVLSSFIKQIKICKVSTIMYYNSFFLSNLVYELTNNLTSIEICIIWV